MQLKKGFNTEVSNEDYHADREYVSSSGLKLLLTDPREFELKYVLGENKGSVSSDSMDFGSYVHALILEPHLVEKEFAIYPGSVRRGSNWEQFQDENEGKIILTKNQDLQAKKAVKIFNESTVLLDGKEVPVRKFFEGGWAEQTLCGEINGVKIKVRFDYRKEFKKFGSINDIKTTQFPIKTKKQIEKVNKQWGYELSAALYCDLVAQETGKPHDFYFCYINTKDGMVQLVKASQQMLEIGRQKYKHAIELIKKGRETGEWYPKGIIEIDYIGEIDV